MTNSETSVEYSSEEEEVFDPPPVVAVVVASNPGGEFAAMLESLGDQDYENLSVLVIDAGSDTPIADRVADVLPEAYIHRLAGKPGFSTAANQAKELVSGSPFLLFCHDDVVLDGDCVSTLMSELYRRNAGIAGPKLVQWENPGRLLQVGMSSDRFGVVVDQVERGEYDQDQYDAVRDIFIVPGGVQLVRADLFEALDGFDPGISLIGEDMDLCWRAHLLGARVLIVPSTAARHAETLNSSLSARQRRRLATQHRLRTVLSTASTRARVTIVPITIMLIVIEGIYAVLAGRRGQARDAFGSIAWNFARSADIRQRRRKLMEQRSASDADIRTLQVGGSARINDFSRGQFNVGQDRFSGLVASVRSSFAGEDAGSLRDAVFIVSTLALVLILGSRNLLTNGLESVGSFPDLPATTTLFREWLGGWRTTGTGGAGNPPSALLLLAIGRLLFFWAPGLFDSLVAVGPVFVGAIGAYRLTRPFGSPRASAVAAGVYSLNPLVVSIFSAGSWDSLIVWAAAPHLIGSTFRVLKVSPFVPAEGAVNSLAKQWVVERSFALRLIRYGLLVAFVAAFAPTIIPVALILCLFLVPGLAVNGQFQLLSRLGFLIPACTVIPAVVHIPWSFDVLQSFSWRWLVGPGSPGAVFDSYADLVRFAPSVVQPSMLTVAFMAIGLFGLAVARSEHRIVITSMVTVAVFCFLLLWFERRGFVPIALPASEALLALAAVAWAMSGAAAVRWFELNRSSLSRLRRLGSYCGAFVLIVAVLLVGLNSSLLGNWGAPVQGYQGSAELMSDRTEGASRVLWIGDPSVLSVDPIQTPGGVFMAVTDGGLTDVRGRWSPKPVGSEAGVASQVDLAVQGEVSNLGHLLAPYGIDIVIVVNQLAPTPYEGPRVSPGPGVEQAIAQQLDLRREDGFAELGVYKNQAASGIAVAIPDGAASARTPRQQLAVDLGGASVPATSPSPGVWQIDLPAATTVLVAVPASGVVVSGVRTELLPGFDDMAILQGGDAGIVELRPASSWPRRLALLGQILIVGFGIVLAQTRNEEA